MTAYHPVSCDTHSQYELLVMHGSRCEWHYQGDEGQTQTFVGTAIDLQTINKEEFLLIHADDKTAMSIRLDMIIRYDEQRLL